MSQPKKPRKRAHINNWNEAISPIDYRYWDEALKPFLSVGAFIDFQVQYQQAIAKAHCDIGHRPSHVHDEVVRACKKVTTTRVYTEEGRIRHDVQSLINVINRGESNEVKTIVNFAATSYDSISTADAARYKAFVKMVFLPAALRLIRVLISQIEDYAYIRQIGRTHLQHAEPITFGFNLAWHLDRIGDCVEQIEDRSERLLGKYSGPVGTHAALRATVTDPHKVERAVLMEMDLVPGRISTQIVKPEPLARLIFEVLTLTTALANMAEDMRQLSATEIGEVSEPFGSQQVGSAGMPHKDSNPISFENTYGEWINIIPRMQTVFMTMISNHQRDLRNSMPFRTFPEIFAYAFVAVVTITRAMETLKVNTSRCQQNFALKGDLILAELVKVLLMEAGHPRAYKTAQKLAKKAKEKSLSLLEVVQSERALKPYLTNVMSGQWDLLADPYQYVGTAVEDSLTVVAYWREYCAKYK